MRETSALKNDPPHAGAIHHGAPIEARLAGFCLTRPSLPARKNGGAAAEKWVSDPSPVAVRGRPADREVASVLARAPAGGDEAELPELRPQRFARHAQAARGRGPVIAVLAEPRADGPELDFAHDLLEGARAPACGAG